MVGALRALLAAHKLRTRRDGDDLVLGATASRPFRPESIVEDAREAWKAAKLEPVTLHECRHAFASMMIAAGVNAKALTAYMGHASITLTFDRYGHLMPGNEEEAAQLLGGYLDRATAAIHAS